MASFRKGIYVLIIGIIFILSLPMVASAVELGKEFVVTNLRIRPSIDVSGEYQTNVDLTTNDEKGSWVMRVIPGLSLQIPTDRAFLGLEGDATYLNVEKGHDTWTGHTRGLLRYNLDNNTSIGASHDFTRGELYGAGSGEKYDLHQSNAMFKHQLSPILALTLSGTKEDYKNKLRTASVYTDYEDSSGGATIDYKLNRMSSISLGGSYVKRDYKDTADKDYDAINYSLGISNKVTPRITVGLNGGMTDRDYDIGEDAKEITYGGNIGVRLSNFSTLNVNYAHSIQDTFVSSEALALKTRFDSYSTLIGLLDEEYRYAETDQTGVNLSYNFTDKDNLSLGAGYIRSTSGQNIPATKTKLDEENYFGGIDYSHKFTRWLSLGFKLVYGERKSDVRNKYDYQIASAGLRLSF